ncbi:MAG: pseudoazurin [Pseudomonadota bacterium]
MRMLFVGTAMALSALVTMPVAAQAAETHIVEMLNKDPEDSSQRQIFKPAVLVVQPGDTVVFKATDRGHNAASMKGMTPEGAEEFKGRVNKDVEVTFDTVGVYGYICTPHVSAGMVGLVVVEGEGWDANLEEAKGVRQRGRAKARFEEYFAQLETLMAERAASAATAAPVETPADEAEAEVEPTPAEAAVDAVEDAVDAVGDALEGAVQ